MNNPNEPTNPTGLASPLAPIADANSTTPNPATTPSPNPNSFKMPKHRQAIWVVAIVLAAAIHFALPHILPARLHAGWRSALHFLLDELPFLLIVISFDDEARFKKPVYDMRWLTWVLVAAYFGTALMYFFM